LDASSRTHFEATKQAELFGYRPLIAHQRKGKVAGFRAEVAAVLQAFTPKGEQALTVRASKQRAQEQ
jgi:type II secretory pathway component PulC